LSPGAFDEHELSENRIPLSGIMPAKQNGAGKLPRR
jgi:hypothetical protein